MVLGRNRQKPLDSFLIGDVDRDLQRVKDPRAHGEESIIAIAAVTDKTGESAITRVLQSPDYVTLPQRHRLAAMELHNVKIVGPQTLETALNTLPDQRGRPIGETEFATVV